MLFLDADVVVRPDTLERVARQFETHPEIDALFGSYDASPPAPGVVSQYKNLLHHFVHQHASENAVTFWGGCGAIRREVFERVGGFDARRYPKSSIEDIELGTRLKKAGYTIRLDRDLQVTHLKRWTWRGWLRADIRYRAIPWSLLIFQHREIPDELNIKKRDRYCALLTILSLLFLVLGGAQSLFWAGLPICLLWIFALNNPLFLFFRQQRGLSFMVKAFFLHWFYYLYSTCVFAGCALYRVFKKPARGSPLSF